jgi:hypothetical protein
MSILTSYILKLGIQRLSVGLCGSWSNAAALLAQIEDYPPLHAGTIWGYCGVGGRDRRRKERQKIELNKKA